jgi:hypothetical protein
MLQLRTGAVTVRGYRQYTDDDDRPMTRRDGSPVECVAFMVDGEDAPREFALDRSINGDRPAEGTVTDLLLESIVRVEARNGRSGRPYVHRAVKYRVTGFVPTEATARKAA